MQIGLIFSSNDPKQKEARDSVKQYLDDSGVLAEYSEFDKKVESPTLIIDGLALSEKRKEKRSNQNSMFPNRSDMLSFLEQNLWCL